MIIIGLLLIIMAAAADLYFRRRYVSFLQVLTQKTLGMQSTLNEAAVTMENERVTVELQKTLFDHQAGYDIFKAMFFLNKLNDKKKTFTNDPFGHIGYELALVEGYILSKEPFARDQVIETISDLAKNGHDVNAMADDAVDHFYSTIAVPSTGHKFTVDDENMFNHCTVGDQIFLVAQADTGTILSVNFKKDENEKYTESGDMVHRIEFIEQN